jgi:hypothetical protein
MENNIEYNNNNSNIENKSNDKTNFRVLNSSIDDDEAILDIKLSSMLQLSQDTCNRGLFIRTVRASVERIKLCLVTEFPNHLLNDFFFIGRLLLKHMVNKSLEKQNDNNQMLLLTNDIYKTESPVSITHFDFENEKNNKIPLSPSKSSSLLLFNNNIQNSPIFNDDNTTNSIPVSPNLSNQTSSLAEYFYIISNHSNRYSFLRKDDPVRISLIGLIIVLITVSRPLKYNNLAEFLENYPEFSSIDQYELVKLMQNANLMSAAVTFLIPSQNKGIIMNIVPRLTEGPHVKYITGGGSSKATIDRVLLFEREGNTTLKKRSTSKKNKKKTKEISVPSFLTFSSLAKNNSNFLPKTCSFDEDELIYGDLSITSDISSNFCSSSMSTSSSSVSTNSRTSSIDMSQLYESIPFLMNVSAIHWNEYDQLDIEKDYKLSYTDDYDNIHESNKRQKLLHDSNFSNNDESSSWNILVNVAKTFL